VIQLAAFGGLDWAIVIAYLLVMLGLGAWASRGQEDEESYFLGGRAMPTWAVTLSIVATSLSAATYIGVPQLTYGGDLSYLILNIGGVLGALAVAAFLLPPLYRAGTTTIYGVLAQRWGSGATLAASIAFLIGRLLASGARLFMAGIAFSLILFNKEDTSSIILAIVIFGAIGTAYTCLGGIKAVIWTDTLQIVLVVGAGLAAIVYLLGEIPLSVGEIIDVLGDEDKLTVVKSGFTDEGAYDWAAGFTLLTAFAVIFQNMGSYGVDQDLVQRMMTTQSPWKASASLVISQLVAMPVVLMFMIIGLLLSIFYGHPELMGDAAPTEALVDSRKVYPQFLIHHMPTGLAGLAMTGMFAAAMSSLDSAVNAMASSLVADVIEPIREWRRAAETGESEHVGEHLPVEQQLKASRLSVAAMGVLLVVFAVLAAVMQESGGQRLIDFALGVMTFALSGLLGVFVCALYTRRGNTYSAVAALITGALIIVWLRQTGLAWPWWMAIASPLSFLVCCLGTPPSEPPVASSKTAEAPA
jgi:SSS family transporter